MGNQPNVIVRVHRPDLSPQERARRMKEIADAAARLIVATEQAKRRKANENRV